MAETPAVPARQPVDNRRAALWLLASATMFTFTGVLVKTLGQTLHPFEISFFRGLVALAVILPIFSRTGGIRAGMRTQIPLLQITRGVVGSVAMFLGFYAIVALPLAEAQAISFSRNLFLVPLAAFILSEAVGPRRAIAACVGFVGVLIMLRPNMGAGDAGMLLSLGAAAALGHAFLVALATVLVNIASRYDGSVTLMFYTNTVSVTLIAIPTFFVWQTPNMSELMMLVAMGILATASHNCFIRAFALGEASVIAPVDYSRLIFAALAGFVVFSTVPDIYTITGALIIVASSFYILRREAQSADAPRPPSP
ncbi:DMT family transporter [Alphaproteobacteria bacterium]|nr:DMT family transporter [PS1 clade bacterium]MBL6783489.1 DMT family transporter [PS1 clade bacterium]MDA8712464.1 DMT family transporter [Alphaproteobacteria bacterium]MDB2523537.1 DMT family transporter [Alphaproteobacteria bacterium]